MSEPTSETSTLSTPISSFIPSYTDGSVIIWDGNPAHLEGLLYEVGKFFRRSGYFQYLFEHRAAIVSGGKLAVDTANAVYFVTNQFDDGKGYGYDSPCPPTVTRFQDLVDDLTARTTAGTYTGTVPAALTAITDAHKYTVIVAPHAVRDEDTRLLRAWVHVLGAAEQAEELLDAADGSGLVLMEHLRALSAQASPKDRALVAVNHSRIVREGVAQKRHAFV